MERRSATRRQPRKKYINDPFDGIEELQDARSSDDEQVAIDVSRNENDDSAEDFEAAAGQSSDEDEDGMSGLEDEIDEEADNADAAEREPRSDDDGVDDDDMSIAEDDLGPGAGSSRYPRAPRQHKTNAAGVRVYTRGIGEANFNYKTKGDSMRLYYGPSESDYKPVSVAKRRWVVDTIWPTRALRVGRYGGMHRSLFVDDAFWTSQATQWTDWWMSREGHGVFEQRQDCEIIDAKAAEGFMPEQDGRTMPFLMGPFYDQKMYELLPGQTMNLQMPWTNGTKRDGKADESSSEVTKHGHIINIGSKVQSVGWLSGPCGNEQYLAVSPSRPESRQEARFEAQQSPAFCPQPVYKGNIQIWAFPSTNDGRVDPNVEPRLRTLLCTNWGTARAVRWCPVPIEASEYNGFGLLASIWTDGAVRVLIIPLRPGSTNTEYLCIQRAAIESHPPNTVYSCLTWIGPTRLAAGCANGCLAVWDIPTVTCETPLNVRPKIFSLVATTYIISIASCWPSQPNLILTSSMGGFQGVSDLSRSAQGLTSQANTVYSNRTRMGVTTMAWHDFGQVGLHIDEHYSLRGISIRRMFNTIVLAKYRSAVTGLATSPCHPFVLAGTAQGEVVVCNPMSRVVMKKAKMWQQVWFAHEWRRAAAEERANGVDHGEGASTAAAPAAANGHLRLEETGLSRILEGFKPERSVLGDAERSRGKDRAAGTTYATIYEEKSAIVAVAWNPNPQFGGWAAVGMADGLLRVEDLAVDKSD